MSATDKRKAFRAVLSGDRCVHPAAVYDPISARIAEDLGFEIGMFAGSIASMTVLGAPDLIVITLTELAEQCRRICRAGGPPLLVDADHGFGNALNVRRTVEELETVGVSALTVEDTDLPPPYGVPGRARLIPLEEGVGKMRAALDARADAALVVVARTGAMGIAGTDECVKRARAYAAAGVDALFLTGMETMAQLEAVSSAVDIPLMLAHAGKEIDDLGVLSAHRVRICLQPHIAFTAAARATHDTLKALREGTGPGYVPGVASGDLMKRLVRDADYRRWMKDYLAGG